MDTVSIFRQQLLYLSILIVTFGIVSTDSYYHSFGLRYQEIGLPYDHLVYRGFLLPLKQPYFLALYAIVIFSVFYANANFILRFWFIKMNRIVTFYVLSLLAVLIGFLMAYNTGISIAMSDVYPTTTGLRQLRTFHAADAYKNTFVGELLGEKAAILIVRRTSNELILVREPLIQSVRPRFPIIHIRLGPNDYYTDSLPTFR
jgi:hypothetical protein